MAATQPLVSVIVPAFRAQETIGATLASVRGCGLAPEEVEVVIAPDDRADYAPLVPADLRARHAPPGPVASGPAATRNRALAIAQGAYVAFLDADDAWEPGYLSALLPLARQTGVAVGRTAILKDGREILRLPGTDWLDFAAMAASGASFLPLARRDLAGPFQDILAEDVLHTAELLALTGGSAPVADAAYLVNLRTGSVTSDAGYAERLITAYREIIALVRSGRTRVPPAIIADVAAVFEAKLALNDGFRRQRAFTTYYEFLADHLGQTGR